MKTHQEMLKEFARLTVRVGVNLQPGQTAVISAPVECVEMVRMVADQCWQAGAGDVVVFYGDDACSRMRYQNAPLDRLTRTPRWQLEKMIDYPAKEACFIHIDGSDPDALAGLDGEKVGKAINAQKHAKLPFYDMIDKNENQWTVVAVATPAWAKKVFPGLSQEDAMAKLWEAIFVTMRLDLDDPVAAWQQHSQAIARNARFMNDHDFRKLEIQNSLGTDLVLELAEDSLWGGGLSTTVDGVGWQANMPTEEVFSMPHHSQVNGRVVASMPLCYNGNVIDGFSFTFRDGVVVDYTAQKGYDTLTQMLEADPGAKRLGEVALVPYSSPIRKTGLLFFSTLFDENAACHLALGSAYLDNMKNALELTEAERIAKGLNKSVSHVDFMFGTDDLSVVGITPDGQRVNVFANGEWAN